MDPLRQHFWLLLGIGMVIADSAVGLTIYLIYRRILKANQRDGENHSEDHVSLSCFTKAPLSTTFQVHTRENTYKLDNEPDYEDTVSKPESQDNASHDYEPPPDVELTPPQDYIDLLQECEENYDDVAVPDSHSEDYDDIESVPTL